jgi:HK97 gp10 family phage protein
MTRAWVRVEGLRDLDRALGELPKRTGKAVLRRTLMRAAAPIAATAQALAPVDEGGLKRSIHAGTRLSRRQARAMRGATRSTAEVYVGPGPSSKSITQEFGAEHHGPQPYMRPAWDRERFRALQIIATTLGAEIDKAAKRIAQRARREAAKMRAGG